MVKKILLRIFAQPNAKWLELVLDNPGMKKDYSQCDVLSALKKANFSTKELEYLTVDLRHSASHVRYNSSTANGTCYDEKAHQRYNNLALLVSQYKAQKNN